MPTSHGPAGHHSARFSSTCAPCLGRAAGKGDLEDHAAGYDAAVDAADKSIQGLHEQVDK